MTFFFGFDAYIGAIVSKTRVKFWAEDPSTMAVPFDPTKLIDVDLAANPEMCRTGRISESQIEVDDFAGYKLGGYTTIGPDFPLGKTVGGCWLSETHYNNIPQNKRPPRVPGWRQCHDYEMTTYYDWSTHRRYYGFHATIVSSNGTHGLTSIWPAGRSRVANTPPSGTVWIDYATCAHPVAPDLTAIWPGATLTGCVFLDVAHVKVMPFDDGGSKHPMLTGNDPLFED